MQLEFTYRLPRPLAVLGALPLLAPSAALLWRLTQTGGATGDEMGGLCGFALMAALAAAWLLFLLRLRASGPVQLDERGLHLPPMLWPLARQAHPTLLPHGNVLSLREAGQGFFRHLRVHHTRGTLRLMRLMLPSESDFDLLRRALAAQAKAARLRYVVPTAIAQRPAPRARWRVLRYGLLWAALVVCIALGALLWLPLPVSLAHAARMAWEQKNAQSLASSAAFSEADRRTICLAPQPVSFSDKHGKHTAEGRPGDMSWQEDFADPPAAAAAAKDSASSPASSRPAFESEALARRRQQLNALAQAGLLERQILALPAHADTAEPPASPESPPAKPRKVTRYRLSSQGWAAQTASPAALCFALGQVQSAGLGVITPVADKRLGGPSLAAQLRQWLPGGLADFIQPLMTASYLLQVRMGVPDEQLPDWARHPELRAAFPDWPALVRQEQLVPVTWHWSGWQVPDRPRGQAHDFERALEHARSAARALLEAIGLKPLWPGPGAQLPAAALPDEQQVRQHLIERYNPHSPMPYTRPACLPLPGGSRLPVDQKINRYSGPYAVAMLLNKPRRADSPEQKHTLPYLRMLEKAQVLTHERGPVALTTFNGQPTGEQAEADIYRLAPALQASADPDNPGCLRLGETTLEIVKLEIAADPYQGPQFRFRLRQRIEQPPAWASAALQENWPDLRQALARGLACHGQFAYDAAEDDSSSGSATCDWAFPFPTRLD